MRADTTTVRLAIGLAIPFLAVAVWLQHAVSAAIGGQQRALTEATAVAIARDYESEVHRAELEGEVSRHRRTDTISDAAGQALVDGQVLAVALWDADGELLYTTGADVEEMGAPGGVRVAVPLTRLDGSPDGVLQLGGSAAVTAAAARTHTAPVTLVLLTTLGGLYVLVLPTAHRYREGVRRQRDELATTLATQRRANEELEQASRTKDVFIEAVSHELRTPLTVVSGNLALLDERGEDIDERSRTALTASAHRGARRLHALLTDLLDVDRLTQGRITARRAAVCVWSSVTTVAEQLDHADHDLRVRADVGHAFIDPAQLERITTNLLANAIRHTPPGARVAITADWDGEDLLLTVADDGPGIPEEQRGRIFEPFERGDTPSHAPGTGLGLAVVARFAELHGGHARVVASQLGGAAVEVRLASARPPADASAPDADDHVCGLPVDEAAGFVGRSRMG